MKIIEIVLEIAFYLDTISSLALIYIVGNYLYNRRWITLKLSCGTIKIRKCDLNVSNLTNVVSVRYFNGGQLSADLRAEVICITLPKTK